MGRTNNSKSRAEPDKTVITTYHDEMDLTQTDNAEMDMQTTDDSSSTGGDHVLADEVKPDSDQNSGNSVDHSDESIPNV